MHESEFKWNHINESRWKALIQTQAPKEEKETMQPEGLNQVSS